MLSSIRPRVALLSASICVIVLTLAFMNYYGQIFETSPILNTNMKFWTMDATKNITKPYLWEVDIIKGSPDSVTLYQINYDNRPSLALKIIRSTNSSTIWTTVHVRQDLRGRGLDAIFRSKISLWVFPTFPYWYGQDSKNPENTFGIEINDGTNLLWYVFADAPSQVFQLPHHRIVLIETTLNTWSLREIDIAQQFKEAGWEKPQSLSFILIMGTTWVHPGTWVGYFSSLDVNVGPLQTESLSLAQRVGLLVGDILIILGLAVVTIMLQRNKSQKGLGVGSSRRRGRARSTR